VAHNVESLIWQRYFENEGQYWKRWYFKEQWRKMKRYERRVMHQVTRVVAVTEKDAQLLRSQFRLDHVDVVDNGIDRDFFASVRAPRNPHAILFLGSLNWRPNLDAVHSLLNHIFPTVKKEEPEAELWLVGSNPPPWLFRQAQEQPGVQVHGNVPDVRPYLGQCAVMAVPLRIGGGSRLKILEALACGTPVVSTKIGAEGLCLQPSQHYLEVDRIDQMVPILLSCLRNPGPVLALAEQGRQIALQRYDWNVLATRLEAVWKKCLVG
jgi:glycosyltransferase involved in cell wall biosynthesis